MLECTYSLGNHLQSSAAGFTGHRNWEIFRHPHRTPEPRRLRHLSFLAPLLREALIPVGRLRQACIRPTDIAHLPNNPNIWPSRLINTNDKKSRYHHDIEPTQKKYSTTKKKKNSLHLRVPQYPLKILFLWAQTHGSLATLRQLLQKEFPQSQHKNSVNSQS